MTRRSRRFVIAAVVLAIVAALALPKIFSSSGGAKGTGGRSAGGGGGKSGPLAVSAFVVRASAAEDRIRITGTIAAGEQVDLQSEVPGKVMKILFREGSTVPRGALLVTINDADLQAQLRSAIARRDLAKARDERQRGLRAKDAISESEYEIARTELESALADIDLITAQIAKTRIRAPFAGRLGLRNISPGEYITPSTKIASLSSTSSAKVDFSIPERYAQAVRPGSTITFTVAGASRQYSAVVFAVESRIDKGTRTLDVRARCDAGGDDLVPGAFAAIELVLGRQPRALMLPSEAVIPDAQGMKVFVARAGKAEVRRITTGLRTDRMVQVTDGVTEGDTVITSGILQVRQGSSLRLTTVDAR